MPRVFGRPDANASAIKQLRAFRDIGDGFTFLDTDCVVVAHTVERIRPDGPPVVTPVLVAKYRDHGGAIQTLHLGVGMLPALRRLDATTMPDADDPHPIPHGGTIVAPADAQAAPSRVQATLDEADALIGQARDLPPRGPAPDAPLSDAAKMIESMRGVPGMGTSIADLERATFLAGGAGAARVPLVIDRAAPDADTGTVVDPPPDGADDAPTFTREDLRRAFVSGMAHAARASATRDVQRQGFARHMRKYHDSTGQAMDPGPVSDASD